MSLTIATGAIVCNESQLVGEISIGTRTVVHPKVCVKCSYKSYYCCPPVNFHVQEAEML
jgi:hypothetical protein